MARPVAFESMQLKSSEKNYLVQKDLSRRQAQWQEFLAQYDFKIVYLKGEENTIADALSHVEHEDEEDVIASVFTVTADTELVERIKEGYQKDEWCKKIQENMQSTIEASIKDGLMYWKERLIISYYNFALTFAAPFLSLTNN